MPPGPLAHNFLTDINKYRKRVKYQCTLLVGIMDLYRYVYKYIIDAVTQI